MLRLSVESGPFIGLDLQKGGSGSLLPIPLMRCDTKYAYILSTQGGKRSRARQSMATAGTGHHPL